MKVLIASGGSGGHIFPAIALAESLKKNAKNIDILFVGSDKALDRRIFEKENFRYKLLSANKLPYKISLQIIPFFFRLFLDTLKAFFIMILYRPNVVVGFGGYVQCPVLCFACLFGLPKILHEQNVVPGRSNKMFFKFVNKIALSFEATKRYMNEDALKAVVTGNPIRQDLRDLIEKSDRTSSLKVLGLKGFGLNPDKFTILVAGGSQGSRFLNDTFVKTLSHLNYTEKKIIQVIHITGVQDYEPAMKAYEEMGIENRVYSFIDRIEEAYAGSDIVLTRSGASAVFELAFFAKPMILVPYRFAMNHQAENANVFVEKGAAIRIDETDLSTDRLKDVIIDLLHNKDKRDAMSKAAQSLSFPGAADKMAEEVIAITDKR